MLPSWLLCSDELRIKHCRRLEGRLLEGSSSSSVCCVSLCCCVHPSKANADRRVGACRQYFQDVGPLPNACYAHAWDPTSTRMFCAGGPLAFGLKGVYMGLWA